MRSSTSHSSSQRHITKDTTSQRGGHILLPERSDCFWERRDKDFCVKCFWAHPEKYTHIAGHEQRQIVITFTGNEIEDYNRLIDLVGSDRAEATIKELIGKFIQ